MLWLIAGIVLLIIAIAGGAIIHPVLFALSDDRPDDLLHAAHLARRLEQRLLGTDPPADGLILLAGFVTLVCWGVGHACRRPEPVHGGQPGGLGTLFAQKRRPAQVVHIEDII